MERYFGSDKVQGAFRNAVVALGNFDGVHLGHRHIIERTIELAKRANGVSVAYTFEPHPVRILAPESCPPLIQTLPQKLASLEELGLDACVVETFTHEFAKQNAEEFLQHILKGRLGARTIIVGYDFTFGYHRSGTIEVLEKLGSKHGIDVVVVEARFVGDLLLSSTEIRHFVAAGNIEEANLMLGRPYRLEGRVVAGKGFGVRLDARTANIAPSNELLPGNGIYLSVTHIEKGSKKSWPSITSIGDNPTFPGEELKIETHLIDFDGDLMGQTLSVDLFKKMREQVAFPSVEELHDQIQKDIASARRWHEENGTL